MPLNGINMTVIEDSDGRTVAMATVVDVSKGRLRVDFDADLAPYCLEKMAAVRFDKSFPNHLVRVDGDMGGDVVSFIITKQYNFASVPRDLPQLIRQWHADFEEKEKLATSTPPYFEDQYDE